MPQPPDEPKIYHIVHVDKLASIIADGCLWCDAVMVTKPGLGTVIGMNTIKQRRLVLPVDCHPGDHVGDYVPFYFCARSIMLYVIHRANHPEVRGLSFIWKPIFGELSHWPMKLGAGGRFRSQMPERSIRSSGRSSMNSTR